VSGAVGVDIRLSCRPGKENQSLVFPYVVENAGTVDVYLMEAVANIDSMSGSAKPHPQSVVVLAGPGEDAILGKFMAPLPIDRRIAMPITPLARPLAAGGNLQGRIEVPLPLAEASPYFADLPLRQYELVEIKGVIFTIGYWVAGVDGMAALPLEDSPQLFTVVTRNTLRSARWVWQRLAARSLQLLRRTDQFPRSIPGAPWPETT
jgi:hypothetical protein